MTDAEGVEFAFATFREAGNAAVTAQTGHALASSGEDFVRVGLMADIPHQPVFRRVVNVVQGQGQFDRAEIRREMPPRLRHRFDQETAQFLGQYRQLFHRQFTQPRRMVDGVEQGIGRHGGQVG